MGLVLNFIFLADVFGGNNYETKISENKKTEQIIFQPITTQDGTAFFDAASIYRTSENIGYESDYNLDVSPFVDNFNAKILSIRSGKGFETYKITKGDTLKKIASGLGLTSKDLIAVNPELKSGVLVVGAEINIPLSGDNFSPEIKNLPNLKNYFSSPTKGNLIEINKNGNYAILSSSCGAGVLASAEGVITDKSDVDSWDKNLGEFVVIEHPNRTKTTYGYLKNISVSLGDFVNKKDKIGEVGTSPNKKTFCSLYFGIEGAKNIYIK